MADSYPYIISNNKLEPIFAKVRTAAKPERLNREILSKWGFTASNDRAMVSIMKALGFTTENGTPTESYDRLRDPNDWRYVLAERMRDLYSELFAIDTSIHSATDQEARGAISRVTGKDDETVKRYFTTFKTLASLAKFEPKPNKGGVKQEKTSEEPKDEEKALQPPPPARERHGRTDFHYNIQIHLPVTSDISVYNAIFKSMKEHLGL